MIGYFGRVNEGGVAIVEMFRNGEAVPESALRLDTPGLWQDVDRAPLRIDLDDVFELRIVHVHGAPDRIDLDLDVRPVTAAARAR